MSLIQNKYGTSCDAWKSASKRVNCRYSCSIAGAQCEYECVAALLLSDKLDISINLARQIVAQFLDAVKWSESAIPDIARHNSNPYKTITQQVDIAKHLDYVNREKRKISLKTHSNNSGIHESTLKSVLNCQLEKVTVYEWLDSIRYFSTVYPFTFKGYNC